MSAPMRLDLSRRQATLTVQIPHRRQTGPLHLLVDSTGLKICGEGAYDTRGVYQAAHARGAQVIVPPRRNGKPWNDKAAFVHARNETLAAAQHLGWPLWKTWSGDHRRSLVETTMLRFKLFGERLAAREPERQAAEVHVRCAILNTFNRFGMQVTVAHA